MGRPKKIKLDTFDIEPISKTQMRRDGWSNVASGMGTSKDKRRYTNYGYTNAFPKEQLADIYAGEGLLSQIIDKKVDDMTREWLTVNDDEEKVFANELERLDAESAFNLAKKYARLFGGSLIFIGALDGGATDQPLNLKRIKDIEYLKVYDLLDIDTGGSVFVTDPKRPDFGDIERYKVRIHAGQYWGEAMLHKSRCIPIFGVRVPESAKTAGNTIDQRYWGTSIIPRLWSPIQDFIGAFGSVSSILYELVIGKYKFADLDEMLAQGNGEALKVRMEAIDLTKSTINAVMLGTDEDYSRDSASLGGISDILDRFMMLVSAVTGYPVTRLFGRSPSGLNATGENDIKNYYDDVRHEQKTLGRAMNTLLSVISAYKKQAEVPGFTWNSLIQLTQEEDANFRRIQAETYRTQADADQRYIMQGVVTPEQVYKMRFEDTLGEDDFTEMESDIDGPDLPADEDEKEPSEEDDRTKKEVE